jgi:DNA-binding transcriptional MerR regulator
MKIGELSVRSGFSIDTIRYYERIGLLPKPARAPSGHRDYDASALTWLAFLGRLKTTGMPISEMVTYARLRASGFVTEPERKALLQRHREKVRARIAELQDCLSVLDDKIAGYAGTERIEETDDTNNSRT